MVGASLVAYYALFGGRGSHASSGGVNTLAKGFTPVSTFKPAKDIQWASVQASCAPSAPGAMSVLVTGSAGFVGFHVATALRAKGAGVLGIDNVNDYYPILKRARMEKLVKAGIVTIEADLNDKHTVRKALDACKFTHVLPGGAGGRAVRGEEPRRVRIPTWRAS